jgi:hypothetical protein
MRRKTAIGIMALTVVAMPAALYAFATVVMWPNSTFEQLFETADSPMMTRKVVLQRLNAEGYGQHATSFVDVQTEAQFAAKLADIKRRVPSKLNPAAINPEVPRITDGPRRCTRLYSRSNLYEAGICPATISSKRFPQALSASRFSRS